MKEQPVPLQRLLEFADFNDRELQALQDSQSGRERFDRKTVIRTQGEPVSEFYLVIDGWAASYIDLPNGRRQIAKIYLPGDIMGASNMALQGSAESFVALTPLEVGIFPFESIARIFQDEPRIALAMFLCAQQENVAHIDRIASIGRTSAIQRVAAFFLQLHRRLKLIHPEMDNSFDLPLTQIELSQVIGLTTVHANRTLREMDRLGIVYRFRNKVTLVDMKALQELATLPERELVRDPGWFIRPARNEQKPALVRRA